jgi:hypothetical protein
MKDLLFAMRAQCQAKEKAQVGVVFGGEVIIPDDPLCRARERVSMTAQEVMDATGYRFT